MALAPDCEAIRPALVYRDEATSSNGVVVSQQLGKAAIPAYYFTGTIAESRYTRLFKQISALRHLQFDWDHEESLPPSPQAILVAHNIVTESMRYSVIPDRIVASVDGGVGIYVRKGTDHYVMIECYNDGDIVVIFSGDNADGFVREYGYDDIGNLLTDVEDYPL